MVNRVNIGIDGIERSRERDIQISQNVAEIFSTPTGKEVLRYLRSITIEMVHGPNSTDAELRHHAGKCHLVADIERRIAHAHRSKE